MGLLTDPNSSNSGLFGKISSKSTLLSWILFSMGVAFIFVMPHPEFSHRTYFSENALLPGLVKGDYVDDGKVTSLLEDLRYESKKYDTSLPYPWLEARFRQLGLEVYTHNFTLKFPLGPESKKSNFTGKNVYGILRAPRASSTEALVLSVPYRPPFSLEANTDVSVALLLTAASFFRLQNYWAKDIIFLITQHEQLGMQAWLEAYHQVSANGMLEHGDLEARSGPIQAAINLEITTEKISHINVKINGLNGQLPNLDLVNLVYRLCMREGVHQMFQGVEDHPRPDSWKGYTRSLNTLVGMALKQATGMPTGNHGLFHKFGIEAITIEGFLRRRSSTRAYPVSDTMGRIIEGIFRSLNNLLERFHQSFFFYLLPSTSRYVSIGMYMPGFGLLASGLVLSALCLWFQMQPQQVKLQHDKDVDKGEESEFENGVPFSKPPDVFSSIPPLLLAHICGVLLIYLPQPASIYGDYFGLGHEDAVGLAILAFVVVSILIPILRPLCSSSNWKMVKCITYLELAALAFGMSLSNFGLAYLVTLFYVPAALLAVPRDGGSKILAFFRATYLVATHPLMMIYFVCLFDTAVTFANKSFLQMIPLSVDATKRAIMYSITDGYIYGNFNFSVCCTLLVPCWTLLWMVTNATWTPSRTEKLKTN